MNERSEEMFKTIEAPTITELFEHQIQELIISGQLATGEKLPTEAELAEAMHISKSAVHNGIANLEKMGFVRIVPRHGTYVANYIETGNIDTLNALMKYTDGNLDKEMVHSLLAFRGAIESIAYRTVAKNHTEDDLKELDAIIQKLLDMSSAGTALSLDDFAETVFQFHLRLCIISKNKVLPLIFNAFHDVILVLWINWIKLVGVEETIKTLEHNLQQITDGDGEAAVELYNKNVQKFIDSL